LTLCARVSQARPDDDKSGASSDEAAVAADKPASSQISVREGQPPASTAPDPTNFFTWTAGNRDRVAFDQIHFPAYQSPFKIRAYFAVAVMFLHTVALRVKHGTVWNELNAAWSATFGSPFSKESLVQPPAGGLYAFSDEKRRWCEQTLRFFTAGGRVPSPPPAREGAVALRASSLRPAQGKVADQPAAAGGSPATAGRARKAAAAAAAVPATPSRCAFPCYLPFLKLFELS